MATMHSSAIILAAGLGNRLRPLTDDKPKCLVDFLNKPIIVQMIEHLSGVGVKNITIVCGYKADVLRNVLGANQIGVSLNYIDNFDFATTNSMYSLLLAKDQLAQGTYLVEGDTVCGKELIVALSKTDTDKTWWAGQVYTGKIDGSVLTIEPQTSRVIKQEIVRNPIEGDKPNQYKSAGILSISTKYGKKLVEWLNSEATTGNTDLYYDLIIGKHLADEPVFIHDIGKTPWFEIDTIDDLHNAEGVFGSI